MNVAGLCIDLSLFCRFGLDVKSVLMDFPLVWIVLSELVCMECTIVYMKFIQVLHVLLNIQKYSSSLTQHRRTRNLNASVYILSINWYKQSDYEMWQNIGTAEGAGACYRRNVQQYLLILLYT